MTTDGPQDPITQLAENAVQVHEMFVSYEKAGFTRKEALYLVGQMVTAAMRADRPGADGET